MLGFEYWSEWSDEEVWSPGSSEPEIRKDYRAAICAGTPAACASNDMQEELAAAMRRRSEATATGTRGTRRDKCGRFSREGDI